MQTIEERLYEHYSRHAKAPGSREELGSRSPYLQRLILRHFPQNREARILDLGCGYGAVVYFAREAGYANVEGVDASAAQVEVADRLEIEGVRVPINDSQYPFGIPGIYAPSHILGGYSQEKIRCSAHLFMKIGQRPE